VGGATNPGRQEHDDLLPDLIHRHALGDEQDIVNGLADGLLVSRCDEAGHRLSRRHPLIRKPHHRIPVVGNQNPSLSRDPSQNFRVGHAFGKKVLSADQVDLWLTAAQSTDDEPRSPAVRRGRWHF
jgi:hypothetical protein